MALLSISLLGSFQVFLDGELIEDFESNKVRGLLAYLAIERDQPQSREKLATLLWPDCSDKTARSNLRNVIFKLRKAIRDQDAAPPFLCISRQSLQFNLDGNAQVDALMFSDRVKIRETSEDGIRQLEEAITLYRGEFLEGFTIGDSRVFDEWVVIKREQYHRQALNGIHRLARHYERLGDYEPALQYAWQEVELEPWREQAHRQLMRLLVQNGQRGAALAQYETCCQILVKELGVEPARETTQIYEKIRDGEFDAQNHAQVLSVPAKEIEESASLSPPTPVALPSSDVESQESTAPEISQSLESSVWKRGFLLFVGGLALLSLVALVWVSTGRRLPWIDQETLTLPVIKQPETGLIIEPCGEELTQLCFFGHQSEWQSMTPEGLFARIDATTSWNPTGELVAFSAIPKSEPVETNNFNLYIVGVGDHKVRQLTDGYPNDLLPAWSPDGEWIAFERNCELWIVRPDGSGLQSLFKPKEGYCATGMAWAPDSQQIAFLRAGCGELIDLPSEVVIINRNGGAHHSIYQSQELLGRGLLAWSQDGLYIACNCHPCGSDRPFFLLLTANGESDPQILDELPTSWFHNFWPRWGENK